MLVFRTFLFGCGAAGLVLLVRPSLDNLLPLEPPGRRIFADAFLLTAPLEETAKMRAFFHRELDEPLDGIIYGLAAGLGFASVENVLYLQVYDDVGIIFQRAFTATLCHAAMSGTVGFFLALAKLRHGGAGVLWASFGIVIAIFLHGLYDYLLSYEHLGFVAIVLLVPLMFTLLGLKIRWARARSADYHPDLS